MSFASLGSQIVERGRKSTIRSVSNGIARLAPLTPVQAQEQKRRANKNRKSKTAWVSCDNCAAKCQVRVRSGVAGRFCNRKCVMAFVRGHRMKVPKDHALLHYLYVQRQLSLVEIAKMYGVEHHAVSHRLKDVGILPRKPGSSRHITCMVTGCYEPVYKLKHSNNGSSYGRRCYPHWKEHRHWLGKDYYAKRGGRRRLAERVIKTMREDDATTTPEISRNIGLGVKCVANVLALSEPEGNGGLESNGGRKESLTRSTAPKGRKVSS